MKVCLIRNAEAKSNASLMRVIDALTSDNHEVVILSRRRDNIDTKNTYVKKMISVNNSWVNNIEIQLPAKRGNGLKNIFSLFQYVVLVFKWLYSNRHEYDAIHSFDLDTGLSSMIASTLLNKKLIYHIADFYVESREGIPSTFKKAVRNIEYNVINRADLTIICTEKRIEQISGSKPKKLIVIHNTPLIENSFNTTINNYNDKSNLKLCYVGGLTEDRFIKEIIEIVSNDERLFLDIAGYGTLDKEVNQSSNEYKNIKYHGQIDYKESLVLNANADIMFAMYNPEVENNRYSAPNKVYEAMAFAKPIIVAKNSGIDDLIEREGIGFVSEYNNSSFNEVINEIFNDTSILNKKSELAKQTYSNYSWDKMKKILIDEYRNI